MQITSHEYDDTGRLVRTTTYSEPEWDDEQRVEMLAYTQHMATVCSGCGNPLAESTDPANEGRYRVPLPTRCHSCTAIDSAAVPYQKADHPRALKFYAELPRG